MIITIPGIVITMIPESLLPSFRNAHHDHFGIAITLPWNPHSERLAGPSASWSLIRSLLFTSHRQMRISSASGSLYRHKLRRKNDIK